MTFARRVFNICGIYGIIALVPQYFLEARTGRDFPPPITHPEFFYGFAGVALAWQFAFLVIARDPVRYKPIMPFGALEKILFGVPAIILYLMGRVSWFPPVVGTIDLVMAALFFVAYSKTPDRAV